MNELNTTAANAYKLTLEVLRHLGSKVEVHKVVMVLEEIAAGRLSLAETAAEFMTSLKRDFPGLSEEEKRIAQDAINETPAERLRHAESARQILAGLI